MKRFLPLICLSLSLLLASPALQAQKPEQTQAQPQQEAPQPDQEQPQQDTSSSRRFIDQTIASLESDIQNKSELISQYDIKRAEFMRMRAKFKTDLLQKQILIYSVDNANIFDLASIYKEVASVPLEYYSQPVNLSKLITVTEKDLSRVETLKANLKSLKSKDAAPDPELDGPQAKAVGLCDTLIGMNSKFLSRMNSDKESFDLLAGEIAVLKSDAENLRTVIDSTLRDKGIPFASYLSNWGTTTALFSKSLDASYSGSDNKDLKKKEFAFLRNYILIGLLISVAAAWLIVSSGLSKILTRRNIENKKTVVVLVLFLIIFSLILTLLRSFYTLDYYSKITALGPEFLLTIMTVVLALSARLPQEKFWKGFSLYLPMIVTSAVLVVLRLISAPNIIVTMALPVVCPIMAACSAYFLFRSKGQLPTFDRFMGSLTLIFLIVGTGLSWGGYSFIAFITLLFWTILMSSVLFIMAFCTIISQYRSNHKEHESWFIPFSTRFLLPVLSMFLLLFSMYWPLEVFDMGGAFISKISNTDRPTQVVAVAAPATGKAGATTSTAAAKKDTAAVSQVTAPAKQESNENSLAKNVTVLNICIILLIAFTINYLMFLAKKWLKDFYEDNYETSGMPTLVTLGNLVVWSIVAIVAMVIIDANFNGIFVVLGGMSLGIGLALKDTIENIICGISLMFGRLKQGDYMECDGIRGKVSSLGYRTTFMETLDGSIIAFQNTQLFNKNFRNLTQNHKYECCKVDVGVAYATEFDAVKEIILEAVHDVEGLSKIRSTSVFLDKFDESSVNIAIWVWVPVSAKGGTLSRVREAIYKALNQHNIEIPFPQRDINIKQSPSEETAIKATVKEDKPEIFS